MTTTASRPGTASGVRTGRYAILEQFVADGVSHIFGNPGTVEQGFLDALGDFPSLHYILTLQESVAIMAADGYARAAKRPAIAQIHSSPGLGNAIGAMYQAQRGHAPIVVIGGDAGIKYQAMDAQMAADLVSMARPVTKWSTMVQHPSSLLRTLRRAYKIAAMLAEADRPTFYIGDGVAWSGAQPELQRLCEMLGADVWGSDSGELNIPY